MLGTTPDEGMAVMVMVYTQLVLGRLFDILSWCWADCVIYPVGVGQTV